MSEGVPKIRGVREIMAESRRKAAEETTSEVVSESGDNTEADFLNQNDMGALRESLEQSSDQGLEQVPESQSESAIETAIPEAPGASVESNLVDLDAARRARSEERLSGVRERLGEQAAASTLETFPEKTEARMEIPEAPREQVDAFLKRAYGSDAYKNHALPSTTPTEMFRQIMQTRETHAKGERVMYGVATTVLTGAAGMGAVALAGLMSIPAFSLAPVAGAAALGYGVYRLAKWGFNRKQRRLAAEATKLGITSERTPGRIAA